MSRLNFVVPIKHFSRAKGRLAPVLQAAQRAELAGRLYLQNLRWLRRNYPQHNILVVTPDCRAAQVARALGADCLMEERCEGLNPAIAKGSEWSRAHGFEIQVLFFPDIARPQKKDMDLLLGQLSTVAEAEPLLALAVASDGGTNALLAKPPSVTPLLFGRNSSTHITAEAQARHLRCYPLHLLSLALDVDRPEDLRHCASIARLPTPLTPLEACL